MDNDSPTSTVERTFWTVWYYITGAVSRFLRPEPTNIVKNDQNSLQESAVDSDLANFGHAEGHVSTREVDEEQPLAKASLLSSSRPVVAWELCTEEIDLGPDKESMQYKTELSRDGEGKASEEGEGTREEQFAQTGNDDAGLLITKEDNHKEHKVQKLYNCGQDEMQENEYEEHVYTRSTGLTGDAMSEDRGGRGSRAGAEEETERAMTPDDHQKMAEAMSKIQAKEENDTIHQEDEQDLEGEDTEVRFCKITDLSVKREDNIYTEEATVQWGELAVSCEVRDSDGVLLLPSENENKSDEGERQVENQPSVCEVVYRDFKGDPSFTSPHVELPMTYDKGGIVSEDELIVVVQGQVTDHTTESDQADDAGEEEDTNTLDEREKGAVIEEEKGNVAANNQTIEEMLVPEDEIKSEEEEENLTGQGPCSEEVLQDTQTEPHAAEFTDREQEVAEDNEVQTKTRETESHGEVINGKSVMKTADIYVEERFLDKDQAEQEGTTSEVDGKERYMEETCTIKPEGETGQEISGGFKNIPPGICEGQLVVSRELNSPTCEETQEGVPEYNNEPGPDENTTQWFLEGDYEEIQTTQLPEEVESKEPESLQNSGCSPVADHLLVSEHMEKEQEDIRNNFGLVVEEHTGILHLTEAGLPQETETPLDETVLQESGLLFEGEDGKLLVDSMKTGIEYSEKDFDSNIGLTEESDKPTEELQDGTEELLVEIDEGLCDIKGADAAGDDRETTGAVTAEEVVAGEALNFLEAEVQNFTETSFFQELVDATNPEQNSYMTPSLLDDFTEAGFLKQPVETEPKLLEDNNVEMQDAGVDTEETGCGVAREAAADEAQEKNDMESLNLEVGGMAADLITERNEKEDTESLEPQNQLSDEVLEISNQKTEGADESISTESTPEDLIVMLAEDEARNVTESGGSCTEENCSSISGHRDVIDEEILDLWIQTAMSEDTDGIKQQEGPEAGKQMDTEIEPSNEEQDENSLVQIEEDKEQFVESNSGESELVSDTEMSSSTAESGFLDQSQGESGTQNSGTQLLESTSTGSFQGIYDMLANVSESEDSSEMSTQQPNSESQETAEAGPSYLKEEESVTETEFLPDSGVSPSAATDLNQESDKSQENTGSKKQIDAEITDPARQFNFEDTEEADVKSVTEMSALFEVEETSVEVEPLEITMSDSPDEIEHTDSGKSSSGSEASLDEGIVSTESGSQGDTCTESEKKLLKLSSVDKPQPRWSEDIVDSVPGLNRAEVTKQSSESEDQMEVDASVLDFTAQRSRIAVKNPRARPPKDPRSLLHMPSVDPTPSSHLPVKVPAGVPLGGLGIGIKLPGLGAGFPVLKKTQRVVRDENSQDNLSQEPETKHVEKSDSPKLDEAQHKPKWMPPRHPGFGNPLMSELKTKLKKTTKD